MALKRQESDCYIREAAGRKERTGCCGDDEDAADEDTNDEGAAAYRKQMRGNPNGRLQLEF